MFEQKKKREAWTKITPHLRGVLFQPIDPAVANAVGKLLLLAPQHLFGQPRGLRIVEGGAQSPFLDVLGLAVLVEGGWHMYVGEKNQRRGVMERRERNNALNWGAKH